MGNFNSKIVWLYLAAVFLFIGNLTLPIIYSQDEEPAAYLYLPFIQVENGDGSPPEPPGGQTATATSIPSVTATATVVGPATMTLASSPTPTFSATLPATATAAPPNATLEPTATLLFPTESHTQTPTATLAVTGSSTPAESATPSGTAPPSFTPSPTETPVPVTTSNPTATGVIPTSTLTPSPTPAGPGTTHTINPTSQFANQTAYTDFVRNLFDNLLQPGDTVLFKAGTHLITESITIGVDNVTVQGEGETTILDNTSQPGGTAHGTFLVQAEPRGSDGWDLITQLQDPVSKGDISIRLATTLLPNDLHVGGLAYLLEPNRDSVMAAMWRDDHPFKTTTPYLDSNKRSLLVNLNDPENSNPGPSNFRVSLTKFNQFEQVVKIAALNDIGNGLTEIVFADPVLHDLQGGGKTYFAQLDDVKDVTIREMRILSSSAAAPTPLEYNIDTYFNYGGDGMKGGSAITAFHSNHLTIENVAFGIHPGSMIILRESYETHINNNLFDGAAVHRTGGAGYIVGAEGYGVYGSGNIDNGFYRHVFDHTAVGFLAAVELSFVNGGADMKEHGSISENVQVHIEWLDLRGDPDPDQSHVFGPVSVPDGSPNASLHRLFKPNDYSTFDFGNSFTVDYLIGSRYGDLGYAKAGNGGAILHGYGGSDKLVGADGPDYLIGGANDDLLHGKAGNDILTGDKQFDTLYGDAGEDLLDGGVNDDTLNGGADADSYFYAFTSSIAGSDEINDSSCGNKLYDGTLEISDSSTLGSINIAHTLNGRELSGLAQVAGNDIYFLEVDGQIYEVRWSGTPGSATGADLTITNLSNGRMGLTFKNYVDGVSAGIYFDPSTANLSCN